MGITVNTGGGPIQADPNLAEIPADAKGAKGDASRDGKDGVKARDGKVADRSGTGKTKDGKPELDKDAKPLQKGVKVASSAVDFDTTGTGSNVDALAATFDKNGEIGAAIAATVAPATDAMDKESLQLLQKIVVTVQGKEEAPKSDPDAALSLLQTLEPLLGEPNGKPIGEAFSYDWVAQLAQVPAVSQALHDLVLASTDSPAATTEQPRVDPQDAEVTQEKADKGVDSQRMRRELARFDKLADIVEKQFYKLLTTQPSQLIAHMPQALQKVIEAQIPALIRAMKRQSFVSGKPDTDTPVVLSAADVKQEEKEVSSALAPIEGKRMELMQRIEGVDPKELQAALDCAQAGQSYSAFSQEIQGLVKDLMPYMEGQGAAMPADAMNTSMESLNFADGDLLSLVQMVLMQCAKTNANILRDTMRELDEANKAKAAKREQIDALKKGKAAADTAARKEFYKLQAEGNIGPGWELKDWMDVQEAAWGDGAAKDGHWIGPAPELAPMSESMRARFAQPKVEAPKSEVTQGSDAMSVYGLSGGQVGALQEFWNTEPTKSLLAKKYGTFDDWLRDGLHLVAYSKPQDVVTNCGIVERTIREQKGVVDHPPVQAVAPIATDPAKVKELADIELKLTIFEKLGGFPYNQMTKGDLIARRDELLAGMNDQQKAASTAAAHNMAAPQLNALGEYLQTMAADMRDDLSKRSTGSQFAGEFQGSHGNYGLSKNGIQFAFKQHYGGEYRWQWGSERTGETIPFNNSFNIGGLFINRIQQGNSSCRFAYTKAPPQPAYDTFLSLLTPGNSWESHPTQSDMDAMPNPMLKQGEIGKLGDDLVLEQQKWAKEKPPQPAAAEKPVSMSSDHASTLVSSAKGENERVTKILNDTSRINKNGEYYDVPPGCDKQTFLRLVSQGIIKKGKPPEELEKEEKYLADAKTAAANFDEHQLAAQLNHRGGMDALDAEIEGQKQNLDSMGDVTQLMQMRLQKYLDAYTKAFEMLSNIMKKISQTMGDMAQNLK